jgi:hypothetical protein
VRYRPIDTGPQDPRLGRYIPDDWEHVERFPLTTAIPGAPVPVTMGTNWYSAFDDPVQDSRGRWWVGRGPLGSIRGGHAYCLEPGDPINGGDFQDTIGWYRFYDQGREGACVGFGASRMMSLLNRRRYNARWLWDRAKERDQWPETNPGDNEGTSVRAAMDVLRGLGHTPSGVDTPRVEEGIAANRWARTVEQVNAALQSPANERMGAVRLLNSWGKAGYPHRVWMPMEVLARLLDEYGEATVVTDR